MGMDVIGMNPTVPEGEYFYARILSWTPLCTFIRIVAPEEAKPCRNWRTNDGDGLDATQSGRLANRLQEAIAAGAVEECLRQMRDQPCYECVAHVLTQGLPVFVAFLRGCGGFEIW